MFEVDAWIRCLSVLCRSGPILLYFLFLSANFLLKCSIAVVVLSIRLLIIKTISCVVAISLSTLLSSTSSHDINILCKKKIIIINDFNVWFILNFLFPNQECQCGMTMMTKNGSELIIKPVNLESKAVV